jgi:hypothetical protein
MIKLLDLQSSSHEEQESLSVLAFISMLDC